MTQHLHDFLYVFHIDGKAKAGGVKLDPLSRYYIKNTEKHKQNGQENPYENTYVMNYSSVNMENIK